MKQSEALRNGIETAKEKFRQLSLRERLLVAGMGAALCLAGIFYLSFDVVLPIFQAQREELERLEGEAAKLHQELRTLVQLQSNKAQMEARFRSASPDVEIRSYLERLIRNRTSLTPEQNQLFITGDGVATPLGEHFVQEAFSVKFNTDRIQEVVRLLEGALAGEQPLLVTRLRLQRSPRALQVEVGLSSIRRKA